AGGSRTSAAAGRRRRPPAGSTASPVGASPQTMVRSGRAVVRVVAFVAAGVAALSAPAFARAYGWPVKPFDRQHAIRGAFDDPRLGGSFHFGVDISVHDHTAVYAVAAGTVFRYSDAIAVRQRGGRESPYWHVRPTVPEHAYVRA